MSRPVARQRPRRRHALTLPEVYREFVDVQGWSPDEFEAWLDTTLRQQLLGGLARHAPAS